MKEIDTCELLAVGMRLEYIDIPDGSPIRTTNPISLYQDEDGSYFFRSAKKGVITRETISKEKAEAFLFKNKHSKYLELFGEEKANEQETTRNHI